MRRKADETERCFPFRSSLHGLTGMDAPADAPLDFKELLYYTEKKDRCGNVFMQEKTSMPETGKKLKERAEKPIFEGEKT